MPSRNNNPISVVQKKKPVSSTKKKSVSSKTSRTSRKVESKHNRPMSNWLRNVLAVIIIVCFSTIFYYFFVRPYAYRWQTCHCRKEYGICIPCGYDVHGIDISHYQGKIDWSKLLQNKDTDFPLHFVFMKATEGGDHGDDTFEANFADARDHGFIRGAYHFYIPNTDALKQADFFIRTVKLESGDLPPVLDVEVSGSKEKKELQKGIKRWLDRVESHYGVKPILYTSYKFKTKYLDDSIFNTYPYWIAHYYVDSVKYQGKWDFWQHTDVVSVSGIPVNVDLNVFNGTLEELKKMTIK